MTQAPAKQYVSAVQRLRGLPAVFRGSELTVQFGWSSATTSVYLSQWRKAGHVESLGGHSDVHMNLIVQPQPDLLRALRLALPRSVLVGADILRQAGWTTQILAAPEVAVPEEGSRQFSLKHFTLTTRPPSWFDAVAPALIRDEGAPLRLPPAWALADMVARAQRSLNRRVRHAWLLAPEDLDLDQARVDAEMVNALAAFGLGGEVLEDDGYASLFDELNECHLERQAPHPGQRG